MRVVRVGPLRKEGSLVYFSIPPGRETKKDSTEDDSPTGNEITYEYSTSDFTTDFASTTDADAPKRYGTERRRMHLKQSILKFSLLLIQFLSFRHRIPLFPRVNYPAPCLDKCNNHSIPFY